MNAGEREKQWMKEAFPVRIQDSCEDNWNVCMESGDVSDQKLFRDWISQVPGSLAPSHLVVAAIQCMRNRGYDVTEAEKYMDEGLKAAEGKDAATLQKITARIYHLLNTAPRDAHSDYWKYHIYKDWEEIERNVTFPSIQEQKVDVFSDDYS